MQEFIKKILRSKNSCSGKTTLIISNEEMKDIMKIIQSHEDSCLFDKRRYSNYWKTKEEGGGRFYRYALNYIRCKIIGKHVSRKTCD